MLSCLKANAQLLSAVASLGTLAIWAVYLHIFVLGHRRQIKPMLVINRGEGRTLDARCLVTNMSREPVHIQSVMARIITRNEEHKAYITDAEDIRTAGDQSGWQLMTRQGPLASGTMVDMGSYRCILDYVAMTSTGEASFTGSSLEGEAKEVEITILGIYGSEDMLIGASRTYGLVRTKGELELAATDAWTRQITGKRERKRLSRELAEQL